MFLQISPGILMAVLSRCVRRLLPVGAIPSSCGVCETGSSPRAGSQGLASARRPWPRAARGELRFSRQLAADLSRLQGPCLLSTV